MLTQPILSDRLTEFLATQQRPTPFLVIDSSQVADRYQALERSLPSAKIYYAVKANPAAAILEMLVEMGAYFDAASIQEIHQVLIAGATPDRISFGNTIKKASDIATAYELGIRLFCFDSLAELQKIATHAPGSQVICRLLIENAGAEWPLSRKFGCDPEMAYDLMQLSVSMGLQPYGLSFHVGSQQTDPAQWEAPIQLCADLFQRLADRQIHLEMLNLGGGFPATYNKPIPTEVTYTQAIQAAMRQHFGDKIPEMMIEPGRSLVADAGVLQAEVVLISQKSYGEEERWVFLDVGKFSGLIETLDEAIKYRITTPHDGQVTGPVVLAGPTCDSMDILYERSGYELPLNLQVGDRINILSTGAYTYTYASVCFNGFPPLTVYCI
jgi:ornithine decarboxylase